MIKRGSKATGFRLALVFITLFLVSGLAYPTAAGAQERGENDVPEQLWKTYPLDPTKTDADAPETVPTQPSRPESPNAQVQASGESDSGRPRTLLLAGALLSLFVGLLIIAAARSGALGMGGGHPARGGSALEAPLRAASNAPRYIGRGGAVVVYPLRMLHARRIGDLLLRSVRAVASVVVHVFHSVRSEVMAAGRASRTILHEQRASLHRFLFFVLVVLLSAGVGLLVTVLLQP